MKIKIEGIKNNHLELIIDGAVVGTIDIDHNVVTIVNFTKDQFIWYFQANVNELNFALNEYYNELDYNEELDLLVPTTDYEINFVEAESEVDE